MESRNYICNYCRKEYIPKRRGVQKFCSNSCRVGSHNLEKKKSKTGLVPAPQTVKSENTKIEEMSFAGVGNAIVGTLTSELVKPIFLKFLNLFFRDEFIYCLSSNKNNLKIRKIAVWSIKIRFCHHK